MTTLLTNDHRIAQGCASDEGRGAAAQPRTLTTVQQPDDRDDTTAADELISRFALFREPPTPIPDSHQPLADRMIDRMASRIGSKLGLLPSRATTVTVNTDITTIFIPGTTGVAVIILEASGESWASAAPLAVVLNGHPICTSGTPDGQTTIIGLAPDDVLAQPLTLADGSQITAPVTRNVYVIAAPQPLGIQD